MLTFVRSPTTLGPRYLDSWCGGGWLTNTTDAALSCWTSLVAAGELIYNQFDDGRDVAFYMAPDVINHFCVERITK